MLKTRHSKKQNFFKLDDNFWHFKMAWVSDYKYRWYETLALNVVRAGGNIPRHIAFVMDGNRRYARSENIQKIEGHSRGFNKLADCLRWCLDVGIDEVTTFAFSIENYKRSEDEVQCLFDLAREKFNKLLEEKEKLHEHGVHIRVIGNISLLPKDLQQLMARAILETDKNDKLFLNIAFSYTSRDEITQSVKTILAHGDELEKDDISVRLLEECLYTRKSPPPDLLFRTSGETRISDFLMWQLSTAILYFTGIFWPQITIWNFLGGIFAYQRASLRLEPHKQRLRLQNNEIVINSSFYTNRVQTFLESIELFRKNILLNLDRFN